MSLRLPTLGGDLRSDGGTSERASGLSRLEVWLVHGTTLLVGVTGVVYAVLRYLLRPADPFAVVNHPWQPTVQHLHVLVAPLLVLAAGLLWRAHVWPSLRRAAARRRRSGWAALLTTAPMIASGYLLQVSVATGWRTVWTVIHVATSLAWLGAYGLHQLARRCDEPTR